MYLCYFRALKVGQEKHEIIKIYNERILKYLIYGLNKKTLNSKLHTHVSFSFQSVFFKKNNQECNYWTVTFSFIGFLTMGVGTVWVWVKVGSKSD